MDDELDNYFISRMPLSSRLGPYAAHQRLYEMFPGRPVYRRMGDHAFVVSTSRPGECDTKPYAPNLHVGDRLHFLLRADVSRARFERGKRGPRYDPVLESRNRDPSRSYADIGREIGSAWLARQGERNGFSLNDLSRTDYEPLEFVRPKDRRPIRFPVINFEGRLQVTDPDQLTQALKRGIGRGKSFGLGLMLVRRLH